MLKKRIITTLVGLPILFAVVWFDYPIHWFTLFIALCGVIASIEFYRMVARARVKPLFIFGIIWSILFIITADKQISEIISPFLEPARLTILLLVLAIVIPLAWGLRYGKNKDSSDRWTWTTAGILYVGVLLGLLVSLRSMENGRNWIFFTLITTFASDTTAFFIGRKWGKHKLAPSISPSKTWEGATGGLFGAAIISILFVPGQLGSLSNFLFLPPLKYHSAILLGLAVSIFGQVGDLVESMLKRNTNTKDSGWLLPGHGGILDRMDSIVFAGIVVYYFVLWSIQ
jgi:phosphatidate cytidylyltransferase